MSDSAKSWLILLVGAFAVIMLLKTFFDVTG